MTDIWVCSVLCETNPTVPIMLVEYVRNCLYAYVSATWSREKTLPNAQDRQISDAPNNTGTHVYGPNPHRYRIHFKFQLLQIDHVKRGRHYYSLVKSISPLFFYSCHRESIQSPLLTRRGLKPLRDVWDAPQCQRLTKGELRLSASFVFSPLITC
jgi:hypothetical protein